jgi:rod shape-determining protein MreC
LAKFGASISETRFVSATGIAAVCVLIGALFLFLLPRDDPRVMQLRQTAFDIFLPAIDALGRPFIALRNTGTQVSQLSGLREENHRLLAENEALRLKINEMTQAQFLMQQYRALLDLPPEPDIELFPVRVVADLSSPFVKTLVTKGGKSAGIEPGLAVIGTNGLIGRVISSGLQSARILLLTDFNSNIPVVALASNVQAILSGRNNDMPELQFVPRKATLKDGDLLVTSGRGGRIPIGLPVGILRLGVGEPPKVELLDDVQGLIHVRVVKGVAVDAPPDIQTSPASRKAKR